MEVPLDYLKQAAQPRSRQAAGDDALAPDDMVPFRPIRSNGQLRRSAAFAHDMPIPTYLASFNPTPSSCQPPSPYSSSCLACPRLRSDSLARSAFSRRPTVLHSFAGSQPKAPPVSTSELERLSRSHALISVAVSQTVGHHLDVLPVTVSWLCQLSS
jgi:hypothetical protein